MERSEDRKVTTLARWQPGAKRWKPVVKNAVGTLAGITCPGMTEWCISESGSKCYAMETEKIYTHSRNLVERNTIALEKAVTVEEKIRLYDKAVMDYLVDHEKAQKKVSWFIPKIFR